MVSAVEKVKSWAFPTVASAFCIIMWGLVSEIRSDVKELLKSDAQTQVKVSELERRLNVHEYMASREQVYGVKPKENEATQKDPLVKRN